MGLWWPWWGYRTVIPSLYAIGNARNANAPVSCPHCGELVPRTKFCCQCGEPLQRVCKQCGTVDMAGGPYCTECGAALVRICATCGKPDMAGGKHCIHCGAALGD